MHLLSNWLIFVNSTPIKSGKFISNFLSGRVYHKSAKVFPGIAHNITFGYVISNEILRAEPKRKTKVQFTSSSGYYTISYNIFLYKMLFERDASIRVDATPNSFTFFL